MKKNLSVNRSLEEVVTDHNSEFSREFKSQFNSLPNEQKNAVNITRHLVDKEIDKINEDFIDYEWEDRIRKAGYKPTELDEMSVIAQNKVVGEIFLFGGSQVNIDGRLFYRDQQHLVKTPMRTVVTAQKYIRSLEDALLSVTKELKKIKKPTMYSRFLKLFRKG